LTEKIHVQDTIHHGAKRGVRFLKRKRGNKYRDFKCWGQGEKNDRLIAITLFKSRYL